MFNRMRSRQSSSSVSISNSSHSSQSTRPPTYTSNQTLTPSYTSHPTLAPTYRSRAPNQISAQSRIDEVGQWTEGVPSVPPMAVDSFSLSSVTDASSLSGTTSSSIAAPRHLYYRIYTEGGAIASVQPFSSVDRYMGRILTSSVPPPHTVSSLKRCLSNAESIENQSKCALYISPSAQSPMEETQRVSLYGNIGPGSSVHEPIAFVVESRKSGISAPTGIPESDMDDTITVEPQYLYYRVYNEASDIPSKQFFDANNPSLGRIDANHITPPHTTKSLQRCLCSQEEYTSIQFSKLFLQITSESSLENNQISLLGEARPGATPQDPMALVLPESINEAQITQFTNSTSLRSDVAFRKTIKARRNFNGGGGNTGWLNYFQNEKLQTDGITHYEAHPLNGDIFNVYRAQNSSGQIGFVRTDRMDSC